MGFLRRIASMLRHDPVEEYDDPVFGALSREGDGYWIGEIPFDCPPTGATTLSFLIDAGTSYPTEQQRAFFREIVPLYAELWPRVAEALANYHPNFDTIEAVAEHVDEPCLCLEPIVLGQPRRWALQYTFDYPNEGGMGCFVNFREWEILGVSAAD